MEQCEIGWLPVNLSHKIGEGVSASVYKYKTNGKFLAVKCFRNPITKKKNPKDSKKIAANSSRKHRPVREI